MLRRSGACWLQASVCAAVAVLLSGCVFGGPARNGAMFPDESGSLPFGERITGEEFVAESRELVLEYKQKLAELGAVGWETPGAEQYTMHHCEYLNGAVFLSAEFGGPTAQLVDVEKVVAVGQEVFESRGYTRVVNDTDETLKSGRIYSGFEWVDLKNGITISVSTLDGDGIEQTMLSVRTGCLPVKNFEALRLVANESLSPYTPAPLHP